MAGAWAEAAKKGVKEDEEALEGVNCASTSTSVPTTTTTIDGASGGTAAAPMDVDSNSTTSALKIPPLERQEAVEKSFENAVRGLGRLKKEMPAVVARMERARKAGEYVVTER